MSNLLQFSKLSSSYLFLLYHNPVVLQLEIIGKNFISWCELRAEVLPAKTQNLSNASTPFLLKCQMHISPGTIFHKILSTSLILNSCLFYFWNKLQSYFKLTYKKQFIFALESNCFYAVNWLDEQTSDASFILWV